MNHTVILTIGYPGSGKSTVSKAIAKSLGATYLDKDTICNGFTGLLLERNGESADARDSSTFYKEKIMPLEYQTLFKAANDTLLSSPFIVIDAPFISFFDDPSFIQNQRNILGWTKVNICVVEVTASLDITKERLMQRGEKRDQWKLDNWESYSQHSYKTCNWGDVNKFVFENNTVSPNVEHLVQAIKSTTPKSNNQ